MKSKNVLEFKKGSGNNKLFTDSKNVDDFKKPFEYYKQIMIFKNIFSKYKRFMILKMIIYSKHVREMEENVYEILKSLHKNSKES